MMFRDQWCTEFSDEVAIADPAVPRELAMKVAAAAHAIDPASDPREMAVVWLAWRKPGGPDAPAPKERPTEKDALEALFDRLESDRP